GRSSGQLWIQIDGSDWSLAKPPGGVGQFAAVEELGLVRARPAGSRYPFIIEWRRDGSNPASLASILQRTRTSLDTPNPTFPPGTYALDGRHFAFIGRPVDRDQARMLAAQAGGTLAVPATREEAGWLMEKAEEVGNGMHFWLGGQRQGDVWQWDTKEAWEFGEWSDDANPDNGEIAMVLHGGSGWKDFDPNEPAQGFVIEWSNDANRAAADDVATDMQNTAGAASLDELNATAAKLLEQYANERNEKLAANVKTFFWDLDVWTRGLNGSESSFWTPQVDALKALVEDNRVPTPEHFGTESEIELSEKMAAICEYGHKQQTKIDLAYDTQATRLRDAYVERAQAAAAEADAKGQGALATRLRQAATTATADLEGWTQELTE
ncbi:MAG: hypothetical protein ACQKBU_01630, partial [Verrucomicrobiales bacterium]